MSGCSKVGLGLVKHRYCERRPRDIDSRVVVRNRAGKDVKRHAPAAGIEGQRRQALRIREENTAATNRSVDRKVADLQWESAAEILLRGIAVSDVEGIRRDPRGPQIGNSLRQKA